MGYITRDIALITEPAQVTLSNKPNFLRIASKALPFRSYYEANITILMQPATGNIPEGSALTIAEPGGAVHSFYGTTNPDDVGGPVFYVVEDRTITAENLRAVLMADRWIGANYYINIIGLIGYGPSGLQGTTVNIKSRGAGAEFNANIQQASNYYLIDIINPDSINGDSITGQNRTAEIEIDVYTDPAVFLGENDDPSNLDKRGTYLTTLSKTYTGVQLWFDVNALFNQFGAYTKPVTSGAWFATGTGKLFRLMARVKGLETKTFYYSNVLLALNGYGPALEANNLARYVYTQGMLANRNFLLLTNKPRTPYVKGQKEYLNFIFRDPTHGDSAAPNFTIEITYRAYTSGGDLLGTVLQQSIVKNNLAMVNSCALKIDQVLVQYPGAGVVRVNLSRNGGVILSNALEYLIRPDCLHKLRQFTFLNRLGGWDTFNFDSDRRSELKVTTDTYTKTLTPGKTKGDSIETVYTSALANSFTVEGAPVSDDVAEWLKELAASRVIFDGDGNYVIREDFTLPIGATGDNMRVPTFKYRLSDTFTND